MNGDEFSRDITNNPKDSHPKRNWVAIFGVIFAGVIALFAASNFYVSVFGGAEERIKNQIKSSENELKEQMEKLEQRLETRINRVERRFEIHEDRILTLIEKQNDKINKANENIAALKAKK